MSIYMSRPIRILLIEDSEQDAFFVLKQLEKQAYKPIWQRVQTADEVRASFKNSDWDVVISDYRMPGFTGLEALNLLKESGLDIPFIIVSGTIGEEIAVEAMKAGVNDYVLKHNLNRLVPAIEREIKEAKNRLERRKAEESLQRYMRRLEQSNKELAQFAAVASHDLQEPLRKVRMFCEYIKVTQEDRLTEEGVDYLNRVLNATERMQNLITDLLDLSRVSRRGQPFKPIDLESVLSSVLAELHFLIKDTQGRVELDEMCMVEADAKQMEQLFLNLIGNALKFHKADSPPVVKISARIQDDCYCEIRVEDNGIGFDPKYQDRIFNIFERLHAPSKYQGTGIGLAICKKIAERHGGTIAAMSTPGVGSTFIVRLPLVQPKDDAEDSHQTSQEPHNGNFLSALDADESPIF
jgi:signal transduction histidine kinase